MRLFKNKITVFFLLQAIVLVAYNNFISTPIWLPLDLEILYDAHILNMNPGAMLGNIGVLFSQPLLQVFFLLEYRLFGLDPTGYMAINLVLHGFNSFVVFMLVNMLFPDRKMALLASFLFALSCGHYGKQYLSLAGQEPLLMASLHLLVLYCLIRNDLRYSGKLWSKWFVAGLFLFVLAGLAKPQLFSIMACLLAYKFLFFKARNKAPIFSNDLVILMWTGVLFYIFQLFFGWQSSPISFGEDGVFNFSLLFIKNLFRYLNLMAFPLQPSGVLYSNNIIIQFVNEWRTIIRILLSLSIISYGFFGMVFGNSPLRFFIVWTVLTLLPFAGIQSSGDWLNIQYLYLGAVGFCVVLSSGTMGCFGLLKKHRWKRLVVLLPVIFYVGITYKITSLMKFRYTKSSQRAEFVAQKAELERIVYTPTLKSKTK
jgi:hypothetical protein